MSKDSKALARILRHTPEEIGLDLEEGGWASIETLLRLLKRSGRRLSHDDLLTIVAEQGAKQRFTISSDGRRIRAAQGHSIDIDLGLTPSQPDGPLFHGTASANLDAIFANGLNSGRRRHVHLSGDIETALRVGLRHGKAVVLTVAADRMFRDGILLWKADNGVWLTDAVPPAYLGFA